jgi:hypothetical protein
LGPDFPVEGQKFDEFCFNLGYIVRSLEKKIEPITTNTTAGTLFIEILIWPLGLEDSSL